MKNISQKYTYSIFLVVLFTLTFFNVSFSQVKFSGDSYSDRVAPGELLPVSIELSNFGNERRADVTIRYEIFDLDGVLIRSFEDTVAVDTTAHFVKNIKIPKSLHEGQYSINVNLFYFSQEVPAVSSFNFTVEKKIFGIFKGDFIKYLAVIFLISLLIIVIYNRNIKYIKRTRKLAIFNYDEIEPNQRVFFEMISDILTKMRLESGSGVLKMTQSVQGLNVDNNGKIIDISNDPVLIISELLLRYEKEYKKKINFISPKISSREDALRKGFVRLNDSI